MNHARLLLLGSLGLSLGCDNTVFSQGHSGGSYSSDGGFYGGSDGGAEVTDDWCGVQSILDSQCSYCHSGSSPSGGLDLATDPHAALVDQASSYGGWVLVVPGDADNSFLVAKVEGAQDPEVEGSEMPPGSGLGADDVALIRTWIDSGATEECSDPGDTGGGSHYHPEGWADPSQHSMEAKLHEQTCTDCHGADLDGRGDALSCDSCHTPDDPPSWRTDCTFCHGGLDNSTGAPPEEIDDGTEDIEFGAHSRHVEENIHAAYDCTQCHVKPTDVLSAGHMFDSTAAQAEVDMSSGLSSAGTWTSSAQSCSNLYCHGNGRGANGTVSVSEAPLDCESCHPDISSGRSGWDGMSGEHEDHLREGLVCQDCHSLTVDAAQNIIAPSRHVNGTVDYEPDTAGITRYGDSCTGVCHGEEHEGEDWN